ncbi:sigma factor-like helix-turn-helix DNA-binding protein [Paenibacillus sp. FSL H8-0034]|uniref:sigma factor-like helix-turn-helix DNA-binding protein n=1 Tax=Paenibacillus sp. FSL H8-0034 TaxID=2954671 RepID=UPI0030FB1342
MHYYTGLSLRETAAVLGIQEETCKSRLHAALKQLRTDSKEHHHLPPEVADAVQNRMSHLRASSSFETLCRRYKKYAPHDPRGHQPDFKHVRR